MNALVESTNIGDPSHPLLRIFISYDLHGPNPRGSESLR